LDLSAEWYLTVFRIVVGLALAVALVGPSEDDRGRPVVLLVHGRGMLDRDTAATRKMWLDAMSSGASTINGQRLYADRDVRVVWYADVLDPRSTAGCDYVAGDARARRAASDPELREVVSTAGSILSAITAIVDDSGAAGQLRALSADAAFLTDSRKRCAAEQRLGDALDRAHREGRPVILVAHSLGAVVAYDYLSSRADTGLVERLITIGSLVGAPDLRRLLIGGDTADSLTRPSSVKSWINIRNENDLFAAPISVGKDVLTSAPSDEPDPHEMVGYLRGSATNAEVAADWCVAFATRAPSACMSVRRPPS
jgi:pimeloyl-ACP methyl ester carboxylesterase